MYQQENLKSSDNHETVTQSGYSSTYSATNRGPHHSVIFLFLGLSISCSAQDLIPGMNANDRLLSQ